MMSVRTFSCSTLSFQIGTIVHEIGHALGFFHGQSRSDRDQWVTYMASNVKPGFEYAFVKETTTTNNNYGQIYDYGSVMHYRASK